MQSSLSINSSCTSLVLRRVRVKGAELQSQHQLSSQSKPFYTMYTNESIEGQVSKAMTERGGVMRKAGEARVEEKTLQGAKGRESNRWTWED